jgi:hypothetical protein
LLINVGFRFYFFGIELIQNLSSIYTELIHSFFITQIFDLTIKLNLSTEISRFITTTNLKYKRI